MPIDSILDGATFSKDEVQICMRQDLEYERSNLETEFLHMTGKTSNNIGDDNRLGNKPLSDEAIALKDRLVALRAEMIENSLTLHMSGVAAEEYNTLQRQSGKPRGDNPQDQQVGFNLQNFYKLLTRRCTIKITSADGDETSFTDAQWTKFFGSINDAQFDWIAECARKLNRQAAKTPTEGQI